MRMVRAGLRPSADAAAMVAHLEPLAAAARRVAGEPGRAALVGIWPRVAQDWRRKQLEYAWLRTVMGAKADFLTVLLPVQCSHLLTEFSQSNTAVDGSSGVNHLLRFQRKVIAEVWHRDILPVFEVTVPYISVAQVTK